ncbi:16S rRNA (cytidine(1402)-2'-O)-methyltransferase [Staphylococcus gallinarum]|jgi:16S rRNA (cytidine1402-2'-O)-methyltransferase|uniref:Ribosomal RNA small subunit methyltransferase I n=1 Tax=Staphylococcus gallinarum TaxID=1293 RepID=A0A418HLB5_STAGA|nr:16S rRNA (cytidine(1402)-2'-O)-methyltransferase [Staphylococcus gallinarum]MCD8827719.1 16S rRNA (cytidine(1402)-2'-O)-methyltransferase [Staphylococcus gallinarum]MCD8872615.1 16S rRNA (cytidine(1402)-2'-O)-methyltransferase [Staphylococcus gallinarum]MCQ9289850.1 16S rRNA (cytidine(1402)-2'-O)-methyltransferase [Staphylococcus gallinarum]MCW0986616.1 16S rRNA (cytidine(1402)-2'-O)-methyltransferase [Staphylococcus gallinarum]PTE77193.1 16S rRNA (cytidine(1402)-2'-O)-methyltransferase [St
MATLYLVGTPIGNLADITYRAVDTLKNVDLIACEDTRVTKKLCAHYDIQTPLKSYHDHNKEQQTAYLIEQLQQGLSIALVSDAGLPLISDPGYELVVEAREQQLRVETVPGPNAGLTALMASGLPSFTYTFLGFLPRKEKQKIEILEQRMYEDSTLIIYESPHRIKDTLKAVAKIDAQRRVSIGRELTKKFEQIVTASVDELIRQFNAEEITVKGEFVLLIEGEAAKDDDTWYEAMTITEHVDYYVNQGMKPKAAIKQVAETRNMKTGDVYNTYHGV